MAPQLRQIQPSPFAEPSNRHRSRTTVRAFDFTPSISYEIGPVAEPHESAGAGARPAQGADDLETAAVGELHVDDGEGRRPGRCRRHPLGNAVGGGDDKAAPLHRPRQTLAQRRLVIP